MLAYLDEQKKAHPEAGRVPGRDGGARPGPSTRQSPSGKPNIKTPQYVVDLTEKFRKTLLDYEGDDALQEVHARSPRPSWTWAATRTSWWASAACAVKVLRQRAGLAMATNPDAAEIAREIRDRTQKVLRNASGYESPRHREINPKYEAPNPKQIERSKARMTETKLAESARWV